jgi:hypothetical protein
MQIVRRCLVCFLVLLQPVRAGNARNVLLTLIAQSFSTDLGQSRFAVLAVVWSALAAGLVL